MNDLLGIAHRPTPDRPPLLRAWMAEIDRTHEDRLELWTKALPAYLMPDATSANTSTTRIHCELATTAILLVAERQCRKSGHWPESVAENDREVLPDPPSDPLSGGPYRISRRETSIFVHSIGPDLRDDGGDYDPWTWSEGGPDDIGAGACDVELRGLPPEEPARIEDGTASPAPGPSGGEDILGERGTVEQ